MGLGWVQNLYSFSLPKVSKNSSSYWLLQSNNFNKLMLSSNQFKLLKDQFNKT